MKILVFTDSRGEHAVNFENEIFPKKLKKNLGHLHNIDLMLCPFKWTTLMDFIFLCKNNIININYYDTIILYLGIVDFSPRNISNFDEAYNNNINQCVTDVNTLYNNCKIINNKKKIFESLIDNEILKKHINSIDTTIYKNEYTRSLVNYEIVEKYIIPFLQELDKKLIFINCNNIHPTWHGNYIKVNPHGRPKNIYNITNYNSLFKDKLSNVIDLSLWNNDNIIKYTIDNMHLTYEGSEYIYNKILELIL